MPGLFSRIISGEIPSYKILENDLFYSFLDINPITAGHTLVIPKVEIDYFFDLGEQELQGILAFAKPIAAAIKASVPCKRVGIMVAGLEVPHAHLHLVPISGTQDLNFKNASPASQTALDQTAALIRQNLESSN